MKIIGSLIQEEDESGNEGYSDQKQGYKNRADRGGYTEMKEQIYQVKVYLTPYYSSHIGIPELCSQIDLSNSSISGQIAPLQIPAGRTAEWNTS